MIYLPPQLYVIMQVLLAHYPGAVPTWIFWEQLNRIDKTTLKAQIWQLRRRLPPGLLIVGGRGPSGGSYRLVKTGGDGADDYNGDDFCRTDGLGRR